MKLVFSERARQDVAEIYSYNAKRSTISAQRVEDAIRKACDLVAEFPLAAVETNEPGVRRTVVLRYPYTIFYRMSADQSAVEIARIVYSARVKALDTIPDDN